MIRSIIAALALLLMPAIGGASDCESAKKLMLQHKDQPASPAKIATLQMAVQLCPESVYPHYFLGLTLEELEDARKKPNYVKAAEAYRAVLAIDKTHQGALYHLAGIDYLSGRFAAAGHGFRSYLDLVTEETLSTDERAAVEDFATKCGWLRLLPGKIKLGALRNDRTVLKAMASMLGEVGYETGMAAYAQGLSSDMAGGFAAVGLALQLLGREKPIQVDLIVRAYEQQKWDKLYTLGLKNLPRIINQKGLETGDTYTMLELMLRAGINTNQPAADVAAIARVFATWDEELRAGSGYTPPREVVTMATKVLSNKSSGR